MEPCVRYPVYFTHDPSGRHHVGPLIVEYFERLLAYLGLIGAETTNLLLVPYKRQAGQPMLPRVLAEFCTLLGQERVKVEWYVCGTAAVRGTAELSLTFTGCRGFGILKEVYEIFAHKFPLPLEEFAPTMEAGCRLINYRLMTNDGTWL